MAFPTPVFGPNALELKEGIRYILPEDHTDGTNSIRFKLSAKAINQASPSFFSFKEFSAPTPGDIIFFHRTRPGFVVIFFYKPSTGTLNKFEFGEEFGDRYFLQTGETPSSIAFTDRTTPNGIFQATFWGKISASTPQAHHGVTLNSDEEREILTMYNRINLGKVRPLPGADNFIREEIDFGQGPTITPSPIHQPLTASAIPVTASRLTNLNNGVNPGLLLGGAPTQYVSSDGYHVFAVFHVNSMSNGNSEALADNYALFSDTDDKFGIHFRTSSLSGFSPDDQYVDVVLTHTQDGVPETTTTLTLTASMNELHSLEASFDVDLATIQFKIDQSTTTAVNVGPLAKLGRNMQLGTRNLPIASGSTTVVTSGVTASADLVEIAFATSQSNAKVVSAVRNYYDLFYNFGIPIAYKLPSHLGNMQYWARMSPGDFSFGQNEGTIASISSKIGMPNPFQQTIFQDPLPTVSIVDTEKPLSGVNFSGSAPALAGPNLLNTINATQYQMFGVFRTNDVATNSTGSQVIDNEQILGDETQSWAILLRQGSGSSDAEVIVTHKDFNSERHVLSSSITLQLMYVVDFSYIPTGINAGTLRLQINNETPITKSNVNALTGSTQVSNSTLQLGKGNTFANPRSVNTDVLEFSIGQEAIEEPERSLHKKYLFDRYTITSSI